MTTPAQSVTTQSRGGDTPDQVFVVVDDHRVVNFREKARPTVTAKTLAQRVFAAAELAEEFIREREQYSDSLPGMDSHKDTRASSRVQAVPVAQPESGERWDGQSVHLVVAGRGQVIDNWGDTVRVEAGFASEDQAWRYAEQLAEREPELRDNAGDTRRSHLGRVGVTTRKVLHETPRVVDMWRTRKPLDGGAQAETIKTPHWSDIGDAYEPHAAPVRPGVAQETWSPREVWVTALSPEAAVRIADAHIAERKRRGLSHRDKLPPQTSGTIREEMRLHVAEQLKSRSSVQQSSDVAAMAREIAEKAKAKHSTVKGRGAAR